MVAKIHSSVCFLVLTVMICLQPSIARADEVWHAGQLICEGNRALVRFGVAVNDDPPEFPPLPDSIAPFHAAQVDGNTCTLADGREVKVKMGGRAPRPYGACGGATNSFASLWVGGRKVLSRQWVLHACFSEGHSDVFVLEGERLTLCTSAQSVEYLMDSLPPVGCQDATELLKTARHDPVEYPLPPAAAPQPLSVEIIENHRPEVCGTLLNADWNSQKDVSDTMWTARLTDARHRDFTMRLRRPERSEWRHMDMAFLQLPNFVLPEVADIPVFTPVTLSKTGRDLPHNLLLGEFDFDNDGAGDAVVKMSDGTGYFDGDIINVMPPTAKGQLAAAAANLTLTVTADGKLSDNTDDARNTLLPQSVYAGPFSDFAPEYRDRYTRQQVLRIGGETLVFATPTNRTVRPTAVVYKPLPGGKAEAVCVFRRVEENY